MKKIAIVTLLLLVAACGGTRGRVGNDKVCENDYLLGVISITELFSPCGK